VLSAVLRHGRHLHDSCYSYCTRPPRCTQVPQPGGHALCDTGSESISTCDNDCSLVAFASQARPDSTAGEQCDDGNTATMTILLTTTCKRNVAATARS
jgi:hypothetical protein